ncbi:hypothetical protein ZWY2020_055766 [Hordeum vulgare]|nr:hypothetical protein ZWY2020_055766 [Hordeum vulgare]
MVAPAHAKPWPKSPARSRARPWVRARPSPRASTPGPRARVRRGLQPHREALQAVEPSTTIGVQGPEHRIRPRPACHPRRLASVPFPQPPRPPSIRPCAAPAASTPPGLRAVPRACTLPAVRVAAWPRPAT